MKCGRWQAADACHTSSISRAACLKSPRAPKGSRLVQRTIREMDSSGPRKNRMRRARQNRITRSTGRFVEAEIGTWLGEHATLTARNICTIEFDARVKVSGPNRATDASGTGRHHPASQYLLCWRRMPEIAGPPRYGIQRSSVVSAHSATPMISADQSEDRSQSSRSSVTIFASMLKRPRFGGLPCDAS